MKTGFLAVLAVVLVSGCATVSRDMALTTEGSPQSEVMIYRPGAFPAGAGGMLVGYSDQYFGSLRNNQYMRVRLDSGIYDFQVKANGSPASSLRVNLEPDAAVCLRSNINPAVATVVLLPFASNMIAWFQLSQVECPDASVLADYTEVPL
ncbi:MAG: hypothetical protein ACK4VV_05925 [Pseudomonas sp.]